MLHKNEKREFYSRGKLQFRTYDLQTFLHTFSYENADQNNCINHIHRSTTYTRHSIARC